MGIIFQEDAIFPGLNNPALGIDNAAINGHAIYMDAIGICNNVAVVFNASGNGIINDLNAIGGVTIVKGIAIVLKARLDLNEARIDNAADGAFILQ